MSKYEHAIEALRQRMVAIGGELYTLKLMEESKEGKRMAAFFGSMMGREEKQAEFEEIIAAIKFLQKDHDDQA